MHKSVPFLLTVFFLSSTSFAAEYANDPNAKTEVTSPVIAEREGAQSSDPRWYKSRSGRQEYLQGGRGSQHMQDRTNNGDNRDDNSSSLSSDPRWYKSQSGRQDYLQGGKGAQHMQERTDNSGSYDVKQSSPSSDSRWYKSRSGRQEYLKGGSDYPRGQSQSQSQ